MSNIVLNGDEVRQILAETLKDALGQKDYRNVTTPFVHGVVNEYKSEIEQVVREALKEVLADTEFVQMVRNEFKHKIAKLLVAELSGSVDKAVNAFRQNPTLKADLIKAVERMITDPTESEQS